MPGEDIYSWSTTAASNDTADTAINWREGQARASVNDSSRSEMAAHAKLRDLTNGSIITGGTANAQTFTSGIGYTSVPAGLHVLLKIGPGLTNTATATLSMDGIASTPIKSRFGVDLAAGELVAGSYSELRYDGTNWVLLSIGQTIFATTIVTPPAGSITTNNIITNTVQASGAITAASVTATGRVMGDTVAAAPGALLLDDVGTSRRLVFQSNYFFDWEVATGTLRIYYNGSPTHVFQLGGGFVILGDGLKPGGGPWSDVSDSRIKNVSGDYTSGLAEITALRPVHYTFKGNDTASAPEAGDTVPYKNSLHHKVATDSKQFVGLVAQEVEQHLPELVTQASGYIDGAAVSNLRMIDTTPLVYALVNCVKELLTRIEALEAK